MMHQLLAAATAEVGGMLPALEAMGPALQRAAGLMAACWRSGGKVLTCGNGGSAADAMHLAEELVARFERDRRGLAAVALLDPTVLTCAGNDFGFARVFARQVEALGRPGDVLVVFTTSGNSPNILAAVEAAKSAGMSTVAFLGKGGGKLKGACTVELVVPAGSSHRVQEGHLILYHVLCQWVDAEFGG